MKRLQFILLMLASMSMQAAAQNFKPMTLEDPEIGEYLERRGHAKLTIQVNNLPENVRKVDIEYALVLMDADFQLKKHTQTNKEGFAEIVLDQNLPYQQLWLTVGPYLYAGIYVNEGLEVVIDAAKIGTESVYWIADGIQYQGKDGELNKVMNAYVTFKKQEREKLTNRISGLFRPKKLFSDEITLLKLDSIKHALTEINKVFIAEHPKFEWAVTNETLSEFYGEACLGYGRDKMPAVLFEEVRNHQPYFVSNEGSSYYRYLTYVKHSDSRRRADDFAAFDKLYSQQKADILKLYVLSGDKANFTKIYPNASEDIKTEWIRNVGAKEVAKTLAAKSRVDSLLASSSKPSESAIGKALGKLPFGAELYHADTLTSADEFIRGLRSKFANKAMIIDFWATWCMPCLSDLPKSKQLHEGNKDLPIEYVYICTSSNSNPDRWKQKVGELAIPGTHIYVEDRVVSQLKELLNAGGGFPAYVVIDANGKVDPNVIKWMHGLDRTSLKAAVGLK